MERYSKDPYVRSPLSLSTSSNTYTQTRMRTYAHSNIGKHISDATDIHNEGDNEVEEDIPRERDDDSSNWEHMQWNPTLELCVQYSMGLVVVSCLGVPGAPNLSQILHRAWRVRLHFSHPCGRPRREANGGLRLRAAGLSFKSRPVGPAGGSIVPPTHRAFVGLPRGLHAALRRSLTCRLQRYVPLWLPLTDGVDLSWPFYAVTWSAASAGSRGLATCVVVLMMAVFP